VTAHYGVDHWRALAAEARKTAARIKDPESKGELRQIAARYESIAQTVERPESSQAKAQPRKNPG
jgi:hypothetical protein